LIFIFYSPNNKGKQPNVNPTFPGDRAMTTLPNFNTTTFKPGNPIDNPYFPLKPGTISVYEGEPANKGMGDGVEETNQFAVTFQTENIAGVTATVARETSWANDFLKEDTDDWFAQDTNGNVWYLGESTTSFEYDKDGNFIGTSNDGGWKTGVNGALPGYVMPANSQVGDNYYQEFAPNDKALDQAKVTSRNKTLSTELGALSNVLQTTESTEITPGVFEYKYYAPGVGLVLTEELDANLKPDFVVELESVKSVTPDFFTSRRGTKENDTLNGDSQSNTLHGLQGNDFLQGFNGNDRLIGQNDNDFLVGGLGTDVLDGGNGQDILVGGQGADYLKGGQDRDQFVFRTLEDRGDRIKDFARQDVIVLAEIFDTGKYGSAKPIDKYLRIEQMGSNTVIRIDSDGDAGSKPFQVLATLTNTNANVLSNSSFVV
jgi:Ca2+-binding RTX toxin-like protein